jgi:hypothetical protein
MLGTIGFTAPSTGTLNANIDENRSGAYNATGNVIQAYEDATYTFGGGGSTEVSNTTIKVFLEGVYKSGGVIPRNQDFLVEFKNTAGNVVKEATVNAVAADANAIYSINVPEVPYGTHKVCVKSRSHLKRCQTGVVVSAATTSIQWLGVGTDGKVDKSKMLLVGDVVGNTNQAGEFETTSIEKNNIINNSDREWAKSWFQFLENPVTNENRNADVDGDNLIKQQDIALILANINYSEAGVLGTPGDN